jgi:hypothetical protein
MSSSSVPLDVAALKAHYDTHGYVLLPSTLSPSHLASLRAAAAHATALTRAGAWPHRRVVGKAFPPFDAENSDSWGVQHLLHPRMPQADVFAAFYARDELLDVAAALIGTPREAMQMELFNLRTLLLLLLPSCGAGRLTQRTVINPASHAFALAWHRDDMRPSLSPTEEAARLALPCAGVQFNTALYDDACLFLVPGTHARRLDAAERRANAAKAPEARRVEEDGAQGESMRQGKWNVDPTTAMQVELKGVSLVSRPFLIPPPPPRPSTGLRLRRASPFYALLTPQANPNQPKRARQSSTRSACCIAPAMCRSGRAPHCMAAMAAHCMLPLVLRLLLLLLEREQKRTRGARDRRRGRWCRNERAMSCR